MQEHDEQGGGEDAQVCKLLSSQLLRELPEAARVQKIKVGQARKYVINELMGRGQILSEKQATCMNCLRKRAFENGVTVDSKMISQSTRRAASEWISKVQELCTTCRGRRK